MYEVDPITGPVIDPQFTQTVAGWLDVSEESRLQTNQSLGDSLDSATIRQTFEPFLENTSLANLDHLYLIGDKR